MEPLVVPQLAFAALCDNERDAALLKLVDEARRAGAIMISSVPNLLQTRASCLRAVYQFATLPEAVRQKYAVSSQQFANGWSCGVERLENGKPDKRKGSFYFNPFSKHTTGEAVEGESLHSQKVVWPTEVPDMESSCMKLTELIHSVAATLIEAFDSYLAVHVDGFVKGSLLRTLQSSSAHKGRCLCYYPPDSIEDDDSNWCGEHVDHGVITGLVASTHFKGDNSDQVPRPDAQSGLHIRDRHGVAHRVSIPEDALFFQFGETLQILSGGTLPATRHFVAPICRDVAADLHRLTFALFFNPDVDVTLTSPNDVDCGDVEFDKGETFGQFALRAFRRYY